MEAEKSSKEKEHIFFLCILGILDFCYVLLVVQG